MKTNLEIVREKVREAIGSTAPSYSLADVLRAIAKFSVKNVSDDHAQAISVDEKGNFARLTIYKNGGFDLSVMGSWNLSLPLDGQSPETLQFLAEILK